MKQIQIVKPTRIHGTPLSVGNVIQATERDAITLVNSGKAILYPPPQAKDESPEELAERRQKALSSGPYKVEIMRACIVKRFRCEPGEVVSVDEEGAMCLAVSGRGMIVARSLEDEDLERKVLRLIEEKLRGATGRQL